MLFNDILVLSNLDIWFLILTVGKIKMEAK